MKSFRQIVGEEGLGVEEFLAAQEYPVVSGDPAVQAFYLECRRLGTSHSLAEMFALRTGPALMTDAVFLQGHCNGNQFERHPGLGHFYRREAEARGQNTTGKVYLSGLAEYPGDPRAWVTGRGDVRRLCEERGWGCEGAVSVPVSRVAETGGKYQVAHDIVEGRAAELAEKDPEARKEDLLEKAREQLSPDWK